ncbi:hypothetical protein GF314_16720 [bacterium]|nr:hypothetical protein [bacterium]
MILGTTGRRQGAWILAALLVGMVGGAAAQDACELPLVVPDATEIEVELQSTSRGPGLLLTWPEPGDDESTCSTLADTAGIAIPMVLSGDYRDRFDRTLEFRFTSSGQVGDADQNRFVVSWSNVNSARTGSLNGEVNLANTGGLWIRDDAGNWSQRNAGLPYFLPYTNLVSLDRADDGALVTALSSGASVLNDPIGVFVAAPGGEWQEVGAETFGRARRLTRVAVDPTDSDNFVVGTQQDGVYVTVDGGETFTQWTTALGPDAPTIPNSFEVGAVLWSQTRLVVAVRNFGLFISEDDGASFTRAAGLMVPSEPGSDQMVTPRVNAIAEDPSDPDRMLVGLTDHGVWETRDGGETWSSLLVDYEGEPTGWRYNVISVLIDPVDPDLVIAGTTAQLIWRTADGGATWAAAVTPFDEADVKPGIRSLVMLGGQMLALTAGEGILESADAGQTWTALADEPFNSNARELLTAGDDLYLPTTGGGIYEADLVVPLTDTILRTTTDPELRDLDLGLSITFGAGSIALEDADDDGTEDPIAFRAVCQDFQGWIVWRSERGSPDDMVMIGRYDKNNPETCIQGFCGDENYTILPNCFSERRAACFDVSQPGVASFYDEDIFNGFTYFYAVTPFDFGDISTVVDPVSIDNPMVFPPRFSGDEHGIGDGEGNRFSFQVNSDAALPLDGEEIYVYPNPLRLGSGIAGGEGEEVIWTNLPPASQIEIFTLAGDEIASLPRDGQPQQGGNMYWVARNQDDRLLASGIYIWRVIMPERGDYWGKLVIIR